MGSSENRTSVNPVCNNVLGDLTEKLSSLVIGSRLQPSDPEKFLGSENARTNNKDGISLKSVVL